MLITFVGAIATLSIAYQTAAEVRRDNAREASRAKVALVDDVRAYYTEEILPALNAAGVEITHQHCARDGSVPPPATFVKAVGERSVLSSDGVAFAFVSAYPFVGGASSQRADALDLAAIAEIERTGEAEYWRVDRGDDGEVFYYATAARMTEGCVACHNNHPASTRRDWQVGDVRGVTSVRGQLSAIDPVRAPTTRRYIAAIALVLVATFAIAGAFFWRGRALFERHRLREAEHRAEVQQDARRRIRVASRRDSLTGLPNRHYLEAKLAELAPALLRSERRLAVLYVDLTRFKLINETLGHAAGDFVLKRIAGVLRRFVRGRGFAARIGGDEFVMLMIFDGDLEHLRQIATDVIAELQRPVRYGPHDCLVGASVGIAIGSDPTETLVNADMALRHAKEGDLEGVAFFSEELQQRLIETKRIADEIQFGLDRDEFFPVFQPQFDARTFQLVGFEALSRWRHPTRGVLSPMSFLEIAEDLGVAARIDEVVLERALHERARLLRLGLSAPKVSVNVSKRRLADPGLAAHLRSLKIEPGTLAFELLESVFLDEFEQQVADNLSAIRDCGIDVEIDDFGSGHASVLSLLSVSPERLKIDRGLVRRTAESEPMRRLVRSIVDIGEALNVGVTAEGVETREQAEILRDLGCDTLQGFFFAEPMDAQALELFLRDHETVALSA